MNSNITFAPGKAWISDLAGNQIMSFDNCTIEEFVTPLSDKAELEHTINLSSIGNAEFTCENVQLNTSLLDSMLEAPKTPAKVYWDMPIMIQARWHKKNRVNKKWLKRYGMKPDAIKVEMNIRALECIPEHIDNESRCKTSLSCIYNSWNFETDMPIYKYRPDQMCKNLKIEFV